MTFEVEVSLKIKYECAACEDEYLNSYMAFYVI